jgi:hypothetical protein
MSRWFRLDDDVINDPKILLLPEQMRWIWVAFLCIASKNSGQLPGIKIIALSLRVKETKAAEYLTMLCIAGLIDKTETGFVPHNWAKRQFKSDVSTDRVKRFRQQERNVSETPPHTHTETHTQTEKKETRAVALSRDDAIAFEKFWDQWPNKVGKSAALKAYRSAVNRSSHAEIIAGVVNYIRDKPPDRSWLNPATFLNQNRWEDQPAAVQGAPNGRRTVQQAADDLLAKLRAFDEPAPSNLCDGTGENAVRLLSSR